MPYSMPDVCILAPSQMKMEKNQRCTQAGWLGRKQAELVHVANAARLQAGAGRYMRIQHVYGNMCWLLGTTQDVA
jgi:hypothetical protein